MLCRRLLTVTLLTLMLAAGAAGASRPVRLLVDGREIRPDVAPILVQDRVMVPLRAVAEALDCDVAWDPGDWTVEVWRRPPAPWARPGMGAAGDLLVLPTGYRRAAVLVPPRDPTRASAAPSGQVYLVLEFALISTGSTTGVSPDHVFRLEMDGRELEPDFWAMTFSLERPLAGEVPAGGWLQGEVAFLVPAGLRRVVLRVRGLGGEDLSFELTVG